MLHDLDHDFGPSLVMDVAHGKMCCNLVSGVVVEGIRDEIESETYFVVEWVDGDDGRDVAFRIEPTDDPLEIRKAYARATIMAFAVRIGPYFDPTKDIPDYDAAVLPDDLPKHFVSSYGQVLQDVLEHLEPIQAERIARSTLEDADLIGRSILPGFLPEREEQGLSVHVNRLTGARLRVEGAYGREIYSITAPAVAGGSPLELASSDLGEISVAYADLWLRRVAVLCEFGASGYVGDHRFHDFVSNESWERRCFEELQDATKLCGEYDDVMPFALDELDDPYAVILEAASRPERFTAPAVPSPRLG